MRAVFKDPADAEALAKLREFASQLGLTPSGAIDVLWAGEVVDSLNDNDFTIEPIALKQDLVQSASALVDAVFDLIDL